MNQPRKSSPSERQQGAPGADAGRTDGRRSADSPDIQGEGNYDATRRYDKSASDFAKSGKVDEAARAAQPRDQREADEMARAEQSGRAHSKAKGENLDMDSQSDDASSAVPNPRGPHDGR